MNIEDSYIILFEHEHWQGATLTISLRDGGTVNIQKGTPLHDAASSFKLYAPPNVEVKLCEHHTFDSSYPGLTQTWSGNDGEHAVNKNEFQDILHDGTSSLVWLVNGSPSDDRLIYVPIPAGYSLFCVRYIRNGNPPRNVRRETVQARSKEEAGQIGFDRRGLFSADGVEVSDGPCH